MNDSNATIFRSLAPVFNNTALNVFPHFATLWLLTAVRTVVLDSGCTENY